MINQKDKQNVNGMILAAGYGTRMRPATKSIPKPLLKIHGVPFVNIPLALLKRAGISRVIINLHHLGHQIEEHLKNCSQFNLDISYSWEKEILGTGGGLKNAYQLFDSDEIVILNSDLICDIDIAKLLNFHRKNNSHATMVLHEYPDKSNYPGIKIDKDKRVVKVRDNSSDKYLMYMFTGIHVVSGKVFKYLPNGFSDIISAFYQPAINDGLVISGYIHEGLFLDIGTNDQLQNAENNKKIGEQIKSIVEIL